MLRLNLLTLSFFSLSFIAPSAFAYNSQKNFQSTATIDKICSISAESINFGILSTPINTQGSTSDIKVFCNKSTAYTINLSYGGVYGQGATNVATYSVTQTSSTSDWGVRSTVYKLYKNSVGVSSSSSDFTCDGRGGNLALYVSNTQTKTALGVNSTGWQADSTGICNNGSINTAGLAKLNSAPAYDYGIMTGTMRGGQVAYKITIPGDSSKVWNQGKNSYSNSGTGEEQSFPMNAQIVPANTPIKYPAQDNYSDTIRATISY